eukprot:1383760-Pleurochrysis_carterae.AAC.1
MNPMSVYNTVSDVFGELQQLACRLLVACPPLAVCTFEPLRRGLRSHTRGMFEVYEAQRES